ncbi:MAG: conjugal transfer protein TraF, partial [Endozoicomonas sp.]
VSAYLYLDRLVKEKSERFARVGKQVIESDPMLDENVRRPISPAAAKIKDDMAHQAKEAVLKKVAKIAGLVFYYRGNCKLCHLQAQSVQLMKELYSFELIPFSTDGLLIPGLPDSQIEKSPHPKLNILAYPALFLMQPPDTIVLLRQGAVSFTALSDRIVSVAFENGWISQQEYYSTQITHTALDVKVYFDQPDS